VDRGGHFLYVEERRRNDWKSGGGESAFGGQRKQRGARPGGGEEGNAWGYSRKVFEKQQKGGGFKLRGKRSGRKKKNRGSLSAFGHRRKKRCCTNGGYEEVGDTKKQRGGQRKVNSKKKRIKVEVNSDTYSYTKKGQKGKREGNQECRIGRTEMTNIRGINITANLKYLRGGAGPNRRGGSSNRKHRG